MFLSLLAQETVPNEVVYLDVRMLNFLAGVVIPLLVGALTKIHASRNLKAVLNLTLSVIAGAITTAIAADGEVEIARYIVGIGSTWIISVASYYGLWKPADIAPAIQRSTARFGIGSNSPTA